MKRSIIIDRMRQFADIQYLQDMKKIKLLSVCLFLIYSMNGQSFQEICALSNTNGTVVNCQHFRDTLYATGFFSVICGEPAGYIAEWDNGQWVPSSISISDPGHALRTINDQLYIAKYEESIDSNWVYVYEDGTLSKVGAGVYLTTASGFSELPNIYDIIEYDGHIIACGEFDRVGGASIQGIMEWDGSSWHPLGMGLSGNIPGTAPVMFPHQMMVHNAELYVVGNFGQAGGQTVNGIAKWNGSEWMKMGAGFNNTVYSIAAFDGEIIVGGSFTESDGTTLNRIARWDGTGWAPLDFGFSQPSVNDFIFVHTLKVIDEVLYIGGGLKEITYSDNATEVCNGIVSYSGNTVNTFMGGVPDNDIEAICKTENEQLLVGGGVFGSGYTGIASLSTSTTINHMAHPNTLIYPMPFDDFILIETEQQYEQYEILNSAGKLIQSGKFENRLPLHLPKGFYFLKLIDAANLYSIHKITKG